MFIDPAILNWLLIGGASLSAFMIGKSWADNDRESIIENTILYLVENNFVKAKKVDGELELMKLNEVEED